MIWILQVAAGLMLLFFVINLLLIWIAGLWLKKEIKDYNLWIDQVRKENKIGGYQDF